MQLIHWCLKYCVMQTRCVEIPKFKTQQMQGRCCDPVTGELQSSTSNLEKILTFFLTFTLPFLTSTIYCFFSFLLILLCIFLASCYLFSVLYHSFHPSFLLLLSVLINMLLYGCPLRKAGSLCVFTSCSLRVALPGGHGACIMKQFRLFWVTILH